MRSRLVSLGFSCVLAACGPSEPPPAPVPPPPPAASPTPSRSALILAADRRGSADTLRSAQVAPSPEVRRLAALGLSRLHRPSLAPALRLALRDPEPGVRRAGSLGIGALGAEAPAGLSRALTGALAVETDLPTRAAMIRDLSRLASADARSIVLGFLTSSEALEIEAACLSLPSLASTGADLPPGIRAQAARQLAPSASPPARLACAFALARLSSGSPDEVSAVQPALVQATTDPDPEVRAYAFRALGVYPSPSLDVFQPGFLDADWRVSVQAAAALVRRALRDERGPAVVGRLLLDLARNTSNDGPDLHVLHAALTAAAPLARSTPVASAARRVLARLNRRRTASPSRGLGIAHCAAAELVDRSRTWPSRLASCGRGRVEPWERAVREAAVLGASTAAASQRLSRLRRLFAHVRPVVRGAAISSAVGIFSPAATLLVIDGLSDPDFAVRAEAANALAAIARRRPSPERVPPPLPVEAAVAGLRAAHDRGSDSELETLVAWIGAVEAVGAESLSDLVLPLASHPNYAVRHAARELLERWSQAVPEQEVFPVEPGALELLPPDQRPRVRLDTDAGPIVIELRPDEAPVTVARFLSLVAEGFFDGLTFHRVVPGFVAQGGDPRGDGYGGPTFSQRCEDNRLRYRRGTVGMALAGRDTGGSQFFVTHSAQPHLEGRYTAFGQVVDGLDSLDNLFAGGAIVSASLTER